MQLQFIGKHVYQMLTHSTGHTLDPVSFSIQDLYFKQDGNYEVSAVTHRDQALKDGVRKGKYKIKENENNHIVIECDEETGQFKGKYEVTWDLLDKNVGKSHVVSLANGSTVDGIFEIM